MWDLENDRQEGGREDRSDVSLNDKGSRASHCHRGYRAFFPDSDAAPSIA